MDPIDYTISTRRGTTHDRTWTVEQQDASGAYVPVSFTGSTALLQIRASADEDAALILELSTANGGLALGSGTIRRILTATQAATMAVGTYYYDLIVKTGTVVDTWFAGTWVHEARISKGL